MSSPKETTIEQRLLKRLSGLPRRAAELLCGDPELRALQEYANTVSITRLNFNDHGPVHMRTVAFNAMRLFDLLEEAGVEFNLAKENAGDAEMSRIAVLCASLMHDIGMTVGREDHEHTALLFAVPILDRILGELYPANIAKRVVIRSMAVEGIVGHMAHQRVHSLEAGVVLVADGLDMKKGRSRIPMLISPGAKVGDIHQYSSASIEKVDIEKGKERPIRIGITMSESVGFFQVESVLITKIEASSIKPYIELYAGKSGVEPRRYL